MMPDPLDLHSRRDSRTGQAKPVLLYVHGLDDAPSLHMSAILSEVAQVFGDDIDVVPLEIGACRQLAHIQRIPDELPHLVLVVDGIPRGRLSGPRRRREIAAFLSRHVGPGNARQPPVPDARLPMPGPVSQSIASLNRGVA